MDSLTKREAYEAMYAFLEALYDRTQSDDIGALLGGMSLLDDGGTADPAVWDEWEDAVRRAKERSVDAKLDL